MDLLFTTITVFSNLTLGLLTFYKNPKSITNLLFFLLTISLSLWAITNYFSLNTSSLEGTLFWIRMVLAIVTPMWTILFLLVIVYPRDKFKINKFWLFLLCGYTLMTSIVALSPYMFTGITESNGSVQPTPGPGIILHALLALSSLISSNVILFWKFKKATGLEKNQLKYFILGILTTFCLLIFTNFILVNVFQNTSFVSAGPFFTLILVSFVSYAIIKHRFLDIRLIVARAVAYSVLLLIIAGIYSISFFFLGSILFGITFTKTQLIYTSTIALIVALTFPYIQSVIEQRTAKLFYKGFYDSQEILKDLSKVMSSTIDLEIMTSEILSMIISQIRVTRGVFLLLAKNNNEIEFIRHAGYSDMPFFTTRDMFLFQTATNIIIFDLADEGEVKQFMRHNNVGAALPLNVGQDKIGILLLGEKASGEPYSDQDIKVLEILAPQLSLAIQNAREYAEILRFNITLKEEVNRATKEILVANHKLQELDKLKDDFVSIASHELRTPMTAIRSYSWMALYRSDTKLTPKLKKYLERVFISTERLINLVNDMLNISRIEAGRIEIIPQPFDLNSLIKDVLIEVSPKAKEKNIKISAKYNKLPQVFADIDKVHQVLLNLIGNALKFTPLGGKIEVGFFVNDKLLEVSLKDSGVGISREDLSRLFQKFGRLDNSYVAAATSGGTGLGLYICKSLVELMGGKIWATSDGVGKGASFNFTLPLASQDVLAHPERYTRKVPLGQVRVLEPVST